MKFYSFRQDTVLCPQKVIVKLCKTLSDFM
nr:MAG TPA: hypothetical protein [Caudoviricetes sp.]